jgi:hypothetical protein
LHHHLRNQEFGKPYIAYTKVFEDLERLGLHCTPIDAIPFHHASTIKTNIFAHIKNATTIDLGMSTTTTRSSTNPNNVWEHCSYTLLRHRPDSTSNGWTIERETPSPKYASIKTVDTAIARYVENQMESNLFVSPLSKIIRKSIVPTFATWLAQKEYRLFLLNEAVVLPPMVTGRFRLSDHELDELWKFTIHQVELYSTISQTELSQIESASPWLTKQDLATTVRRFNHKNESIAILALNLLFNLFGEKSMVETLESLDETLVLEAGIAPEDRHLMIWLDNTGDITQHRGLSGTTTVLRKD